MRKLTVAILGASRDRQKFGNKSVRAHVRAGFEVYPVNPNANTIEGLNAYPNLASIPVGDLDRISIYVPPEVGMGLLDEIKHRGAREIWFNPGSESVELLRRAAELELNPICACSIVDVGMSPHQLSDE
ncbi:MAG: CoA-binding protein [Planctomycetales bacterium]|nr:CoA-binding protein [Planctomycetales bacterium]